MLWAFIPFICGGAVSGHRALYAQGLDAKFLDAFWIDNDRVDAPESLSLPLSGFNTFAQLPAKNCFENDSSRAPEFDIAILGAPHDTASRKSRCDFRAETRSIHIASNSPTNRCERLISVADRDGSAWRSLRAIWNPYRKPSEGIWIQCIHR